ncbi:hypothetical protein TKK_0006253 [Trichogramma kaykai]
MKIRPVLFTFFLSVSCIYAKAVSEEESNTANNEIDQNKPEDEQVLIGTNTPLYIAKYDEETEKIKYQAYHYPEPQTKNSCKKEQHQKLSPKEHIESEKTYHEHEDTVYPKILVAVDYSLYKKYGGNVFKIAQVAAAYWNSVDLPYRTIKNPKIRLNIAGLIITENPEAIPYVEKNYNHNLGSFEGNKVLDDMTSHFKDYGKHLDGIPEHSFDTVILMTNRLNIKYWTGVARPNQRFGKDTVGFVTGNFEHSLSTVNTGAHEQGHLLNAKHDWERGCPESHHIMSYSRARKAAFAWSQCSLRDIAQFLKNKNKYLRNRPNIGKPHSRVLPGSFATRDQQCQSIGTLLSDNWNLIPSNFAHVPQDKVEDCSVQYCARRNAETNYEAEEIKTVLPPLDGTSCGCGKICFHGECVEDQE